MKTDLERLEAKENSLRNYHQKSCLNKGETAKELGGISTETLDRIRRDGDIVSRKIRGKVMFDLDEIARYLVGL